jgi:DNA-binding XRE family transcriptional regulator
VARDPESPNSHGRSEIWARPQLRIAVRAELAGLGARLRFLRQRHKLTQEGAAERIGIHAKTLQRIETGRANVTVAVLVAVARAYRSSIVGLFAEDSQQSGEAAELG